MSQENVEIVRAVYERWGEGDFSAGAELWDRYALFIPASEVLELPEAGFYVGAEGVREFLKAWLKPWTTLTIEAEDVLEAETSVVVTAVQRGAGGGSGAVAELRQFHVWTFRGGAVIRFETFRDRREALEAVGLSQ